IAANKTSTNSFASGSLSTYQQQHITINHELYSNNSITTTSSINSYPSTVSSTTQRPQAIVTPMTATVTSSDFPTTTVIHETIKTDDSKGQNNGMIPDIKNNNSFEEKEEKLNNQHCTQCSTANSQRNTNASNISITTTTSGSSGSNSNNFHNILDQHITTMIDDSQSTIINSDLIETEKIDTISADDDLTTANHSIKTSTKNQKSLSPVVEDSNSSDFLT
ncbi:unnamed protein product, partial [Brugia pahangi]|uniref:47 kDa protein n=1 Tax=Brugia pahangi TaxID=6280 RepID=A0A0N4TBB1_BRUPA